MTRAIEQRPRKDGGVMLMDWIRREPVKFAAFAQAVAAVLLQVAAEYGLGMETAAGLNVVVALGLGWVTAAVVVPTVKLSDAAIDKAAGMDKAAIAKVAETKAEAKA
jgi:hypothetical protein